METLFSTPLMQPPEWSLTFEIICDASDYVVGVALRHKRHKKLYAINYASHMLGKTQIKHL